MHFKQINSVNPQDPEDRSLGVKLWGHGWVIFSMD